MQAIVVTFDRLATRLLGCYGNEWIETPHFDRLASTATVYDDHFADTVGPSRGRAWMTGRHALRNSEVPGPASPGEFLRAAGVSRRVVTSDVALLSGFTKANFDQCQSVSGSEGLDANPSELVQAGVATLNDESFGTDKRLLWLHAPEPGLPPEGFATLYFEDFEERGVDIAEIRREEWGRQLAVAGGSVSLVDHWLGVLVEAIQTASRNRPTLILIAASGGRAWMEEFIAASPAVKRDSPVVRLRDQETKSPLILAVSHDERSSLLSSIRCKEFVQPMDVLPTLLDWFGQSAVAEQFHGQSLLRVALGEGNEHEAIVFGDEDCCLGIRTRKWSCLARITDPLKSLAPGGVVDERDWPDHVQLFVKPDDIWDVTDVSTQYPSICQQLLQNIDAIRLGTSTGRSLVGGLSFCVKPRFDQP